MIKHINVFAIIILFISAAAVFPQKETRVSPKKAAVIADSVKKKIAGDTTAQKAAPSPLFKALMPKSTLSYNAEGYLINKDELYRSDYRSIGDLFYSIPFGFEQYLGGAGLAHETMLYGNGFGSTSFSDDGVLLNNRLLDSYDLTNFQSEKIDSVEVYSMPKAFLFNTLNSNSAINFVTKDRTKEKQYSRLRFHQGSFKEGFIDFIYSMPFSKKLFVTSEITNNSIRDRYYNSEAGGWRASVKMRYNASEKVNLLVNYNYVNTETKYNGGVNLDSLKLIYPGDWQKYLYEEQRAPVNFRYTGQKVLNHSASVRMLAGFAENTPTDLTVYYKYGLNEYRQNDTLDYINNPKSAYKLIRDNNKYYTFGTLFNQGFSFKYFDLKFILNYEGNKLESPLLPAERKTDLLSLSAISTFHLIDSTVHPSVFAKQLRYNSGSNSESYPGAGADINISLMKDLFVYAGYSYYKKPYTIFEEEGLTQYAALPSQNISNFETGIRYHTEDYDIRLGYFNTRNSNYAVPVIVKPDGVLENSVGYYSTVARNYDGLNANFKYRYWKMLLTANATTYLNRNAELVNSPSFTFDGGIFFTDILFNKNLDLKAGFNFKFYTAQNFFLYDFEKQASSQLIRSSAAGANNPILKTSDVFRIDFFMAGKVQDAAIIYFTFENLLDKDYFIVPYYPALGRNIRFGISWEFLD